LLSSRARREDGRVGGQCVSQRERERAMESEKVAKRERERC
jgi:hypothetical protein